jgi:hypothetical protein
MNTFLDGCYLENTDGHDKWWALIKKPNGTWECWYGGRGKIHPKPTDYDYATAMKKFSEKIGKGYKMRGEVNKYSDLVFIQDVIKNDAFDDGWARFERSQKQIIGAVAKEKVEPKSSKKENSINFMEELLKA